MRYKYEGEIATPVRGVYKPHGLGKLTCYEDGGNPDCMADVYHIYEGAFDKGHVTGGGRTIHGGHSDSPGYIYDGEHRDWEAHGRGTSFRADGTEEYEGRWESDYWHGHGILFHLDGITPVHDDGRYWTNGSSYSYEDGSRYEGEWHDENEQKHGWGIKYRPDGTIEHSGWWENDQPVDEPPPNDPDAP